MSRCRFGTRWPPSAGRRRYLSTLARNGVRYDARWCVEGPGLPPLPVDTREEAERLRDLLDAAFDAGAKCGARERTRALLGVLGLDPGLAK